MRRDRGIFADPPVVLEHGQEWQARRSARVAAREARRTLRTARGQYRRYRDSAGRVYLDWPQWHTEYLREYRGSQSGSSDGVTGADLG